MKTLRQRRQNRQFKRELKQFVIESIALLLIGGFIFSFYVFFSGFYSDFIPHMGACYAN